MLSKLTQLFVSKRCAKLIGRYAHIGTVTKPRLYSFIQSDLLKPSDQALQITQICSLPKQLK
jgi:hypothetical protein